MASTRFNNDTARIEKYLQESTGPGRYALNVPGNGLYMPFNEDPHIRLQKWGANESKHRIDIENELFSMQRGANRDLLSQQYDKTYKTKLSTHNYSVVNSQTDETRATNPAWNIRDIDIRQDVVLQLNPQENLEYKFNHNINTRNVEVDNYVPHYPNVSDNNNTPYCNWESVNIIGSVNQNNI